MAPPITLEAMAQRINSLRDGEFKFVSLVGNERPKSQSNVEVTHLPCGNTFPIQFTNLMYRKTCKFCHGSKRRVTDSRVNELLRENRPGYRLGGMFTSLKEKAEFVHEDCGTVFSKVAFDVIYNGRLCPTCSPTVASKTDAEMTEIINSTSGYHVLRVVDTTTRAALHRFEIEHECGHVYEVTFHNFHVNGTRCPKCAMRHTLTPTASRGIIRICEWLKDKGYDFEQEKKFDDLRSDRNWRLRYDFYVPEFNLLIEFDGHQHSSGTTTSIFTQETLERIRKHDAMKNQYATEKGYELLRISYTDTSYIAALLSDKVDRIQSSQNKVQRLAEGRRVQANGIRNGKHPSNGG